MYDIVNEINNIMCLPRKEWTAEQEKIMNILGIKEAEQAEKYVDENAILGRKVFDFIKENSKIKTEKLKK